MNRLLHRAARARERSHGLDIERPVQLRAIATPQHRDSRPIPRLEHIVLIDPDGREVRKPRLCQDIQRKVAKMAIVALEQGELRHAQVYGVSGGQA